MFTQCYRLLYVGLLLVWGALLTGCAPNAAYRTAGIKTDCPAQGCQDAVLEQHADYDLGFVEFTDRGNVFDRAQMNMLLHHVEQYAHTPDGATVVVFVHGWKHNASAADLNVKSFRHLLQQSAQMGVSGKRRLIGIFVGWRGQSLDMPLGEHLTYWARKDTAQNVGNGGVTELLLRLERSTAAANTATDPNHTIFLTIGHSFGGLVLVSALHDVLLDRALSTTPVGHQFCGSNADTCQTCVQTRPFGHGVILLNPAAEANELLQLKETVAEEQCYAKTQQKLLHVVSSQADTATNIAFRAGQYVGVSVTDSELPLKRIYKGKPVTLDEHELDTITLGNYLPFRTGVSLKHDRSNSNLCQTQGQPRNECYIPCKKDDAKCVSPTHRQQHIPVGSSEPLHFLYTDANFIRDHNDIFNPRVGGYIAAVAAESSYKRLLAAGMDAHHLVGAACLNDAQDDFDFPHCFDYFSAAFRTQKLH